MRELFTEAEAELAACNGDATRSALHVVVIDEIDAVFRRRSAGEDSGEQTRVSTIYVVPTGLIRNLPHVGIDRARKKPYACSCPSTGKKRMPDVLL